MRAINDLRKKQGFEIADRITVALSADTHAIAMITAHLGYITAEVLAIEMPAFVPTSNEEFHAVEIAGHALGVTLTLAPA